jgi:hypothetical protein
MNVGWIKITYKHKKKFIEALEISNDAAFDFIINAQTSYHDIDLLCQLMHQLGLNAENNIHCAGIILCMCKMNKRASDRLTSREYVYTYLIDYL